MKKAVHPLFANNIRPTKRLDLEAHALSPSSGPLLFPVLGANLGSGVRSRFSGHAEVFVGSPALAGSPQKNSVGTKG